MVNYTIIIPHKNIPDLLQRCLSSIPLRKDVQVIVVDDNSDLAKVDFTHFPGCDRAGVECYFTKEGRGAGYARNVGLKHAHGKWLLFADADDFFHDGILQMLDKWVDSDNDIVYFETDSVLSETLESVKSRLCLCASQITKDRLANNCEWGVTWGKMIRLELVRTHHISFDEVQWGNDVMFSVYCSYYAGRNVDISNDILYCATIRKDSLTREKKTIEQVMCRLDVGLRFERFAIKHRMHMVTLSGAHMPFSAICLGDMRQFGEKSYRQAKIYYLKHAHFLILAIFFKNVIKFFIRHRLLRVR